jgi:ribosome biogenesis protein BMS1
MAKESGGGEQTHKAHRQHKSGASSKNNKKNKNKRGHGSAADQNQNPKVYFQSLLLVISVRLSLI